MYTRDEKIQIRRQIIVNLTSVDKEFFFAVSIMDLFTGNITLPVLPLEETESSRKITFCYSCCKNNDKKETAFNHMF